MDLRVCLAIALLFACVCVATAQQDDTIARFAFDGDTKDATGTVGVAEGEAQFVEGREGQALDPQWKPLTVASRPELLLSPGLTIDCWVYFDRPATGYQQIVIKDKEYQLRVDAEGEGGRFVFFTYLEGWEPRVGKVVPKVDTWYHLVASWTGTEAASK